MRERRRIQAEGQDFAGRLHISASPAYEPGAMKPLVMLTLTARGTPLTPDIEGVLGFFDLGRDSIVRAFHSITTEAMHRVWKEKE